VQMEKILAHRVELAVNQNSKNDCRVFTVAANCVTKWVPSQAADTNQTCRWSGASEQCA
jgi:hypothetical protein